MPNRGVHRLAPLRSARSYNGLLQLHRQTFLPWFISACILALNIKETLKVSKAIRVSLIVRVIVFASSPEEKPATSCSASKRSNPLSYEGKQGGILRHSCSCKG